MLEQNNIIQGPSVLKFLHRARITFINSKNTKDGHIWGRMHHKVLSNRGEILRVIRTQKGVRAVFN